MLGRWPGVGLRVHRRRALPTATPKGELRAFVLVTAAPSPHLIHRLSPHFLFRILLASPFFSLLHHHLQRYLSSRSTYTDVHPLVLGRTGFCRCRSWSCPPFSPSTVHHDEQSGGYASCSSALLRTHSSLSHSFQYVLSIFSPRIDQR